ncbi:MAG: hypothetical protein ABFR75_00715 [Acidobacteriota bacterium]
MENKEIENVGDFFIENKTNLTLEEKWDKLYESWINKVDSEKHMLSLFELKLWLESIEEFFSSDYLESIIFKFQTVDSRDYSFYLNTFSKILGKILKQLKDLDFKKDKRLINFEEFIVEKVLEKSGSNRFPSLRDINSPESWFFSFRTFLHNIRVISNDLVKSEILSQRTFSSVKKLYHKELLNNPIIISLLNGKFIPKMDKIYQKDISDIISEIGEKKLKKNIGILYILAFRTLKVNNFIELNIKKNRDTNISIPLILALKKHINSIDKFYRGRLNDTLLESEIPQKHQAQLSKAFNSFHQEYKKIFETEFLNFFHTDPEKFNKRNLLRNIVYISDIAIQELIENISKLFNPEFEGVTIFENYLSRNQRSVVLKKKLMSLHTKINDFFSKKGSISSSDLFFELNLFIETDLNFLLYKDWSEFLNHYNNLQKSDFTPEFKLNLKAFHTYITEILKEIVDNKG